MAEKPATDLRRVVVYTNPDSGFTLEKFSLKIGNKKGPILECSVEIFSPLTRTDQVEDLRRIHTVQEGARTMPCLDSVDLTELVDEGYICTCGKHLVHVGNIPLAVCQLLEFPDDFVVEQQ